MTNLLFNEVANPGNKTKRWMIRSSRDNSVLGYIEFKPTWRKYVWGMLEGVIFDVSCTEEVVEFLKDIVNVVGAGLPVIVGPVFSSAPYPCTAALGTINPIW